MGANMNNEQIAVSAALAGEATQNIEGQNSNSRSQKNQKIEKGHFLKELVKDLIGQSWTLLGLVVAYLVLEGSAKQLTGNLILATLAIWVLTFPIRYNKRDQNHK